ncbi:MAG: prepilin-type N-terminal cleavage/methylation domain-containing protein [Magnetococcales bacterium]|nr:prepilin-type N-terminal cleavage/methylation domain-containing protein [Magnetococcales bacterium]
MDRSRISGDFWMSHHNDTPDVRSRRSAGFTLIEMVITLVILSIVAGTGVAAMTSAFKAMATGQAIAPLSIGGRIIMERIRKELRNAQCTQITQPGGNGKLQLIDNSGRTLLIHQGVNDNAVYLTFNGDGINWQLGEKVLANSLQFTGLSCAGVGVPPKPRLVTVSFSMRDTLPDGGTITLPFRTSVYIRSS